MTKIITVHGTNAGDPSDSGEQWWQTGSAFQTRLQSLIKQKLDFVPFHWSGANSENERRKAARKLFKFTRKLDKAGDAYGVIGHSHGGSVAVEALRVAMLGQVADSWFGKLIDPSRRLFDIDKRLTDKRSALRFWATIGAPLISYPRLGYWRLVAMTMNRVIVPTCAYMFALAVTTLYAPHLFYLSLMWFTAGDVAASEIDPATTELLTKALPLTVYGTIAAAAITTIAFFIYLGAYQGWYSRLLTERLPPKRREQYQSFFEKCWISLTDSADEAVNALRMSKSATVKITPTALGARPLATATALLLTSGLYAAVFFWLRDFDFDSYRSYGNGDDMLVFQFVLDIFKRLLVMLYGIEPRFLAFGVGNFVVTALSLAALLTGPAKIISSLVAKGSDRVISGFARKSAFGVDLPLLEDPTITLAPPEFSAEWKTLPEAPSKAVHDFANRYAADLVAKGRQLLGFAQLGLTNEELLRQITETVTWNELIHTAYFEVDEFVKLLAYSIIQKCELEPSDAFLADPDYARVKEWHDAIAPAAETLA
ncbi:MAG: hypothetical protein R3C58_03035 [Parvularculaceae bacterium]